MADTNTIGQVPESNVDSLYNEVDNTLAPIPEVPSTITETSIHNTESHHIGDDREVDTYLKIDKGEKVNLPSLEDKKITYAPTANLEVAHFADKRFISKQLSDKNDLDIIRDLNNEISRSYETDVVLAKAINLEDEEREKADAQLRADIAKEALIRANTDADLANALAKYKYAMSQHIITRELDVNGDTRINIEVQDGDKHGGNLNVNTTLIVGSEESSENGTSTSEGKVIGDAYIKHNLFVENNLDLGHDLTVGEDLHVKGNTLLDKTLNVGKATTLQDTLDVKKNTTIGTTSANANLLVNGSETITKNLKVNGNTEIDGNTTLNSVVNIKDDTGSQKEFSDIVGTIKNALIKDFTQRYDSSTGKLTSTLEFRNTWTNDSDRPTVEKIEKTIDLDLEKFIVDINDVYATSSVSNGKVVYSDVDISTLTTAQLEEIDSPDYSGNIKRYLKVTYSTYGNNATSNDGSSKADKEYSYVYFEINEVFKSLSSRLNTLITKEINDRKAAIDALNVALAGKPGSYLQKISETNGKISTVIEAFDTAISSSSTNNNAPTSKAVYDYLKNHEKTITLRDAAGNVLFSFVCYAPDAADYNPTVGPITLNTTTII